MTPLDHILDKKAVAILVWSRSHRTLTASSRGPVANHNNLLVRLSKVIGLWLVGLTTRMILRIYFNQCYIVMQACARFPERGWTRAAKLHSFELSTSRIVAQQRLARIDPRQSGWSLGNLQPLWRPHGDFA
jgi:hypothetical protein